MKDMQTLKSYKVSLTFGCDLCDRLQNFFFHFQMIAEILPFSLDASLFGQLRQFFLVRNYEADHVVLVTTGTKRAM